MAICSEIDATILNKQSRTADKGWSTSLGVGRGATNPLRKKKITTLRTIHNCLGLGLILWYKLSNEKGARDYVAQDRDRWRFL